MVSIEAIRKHNASLKKLGPGLVAVFGELQILSLSLTHHSHDPSTIRCDTEDTGRKKITDKSSQSVAQAVSVFPPPANSSALPSPRACT
jgi:hypothetical protein